jgi:hypothetical protein
MAAIISHQVYIVIKLFNMDYSYESHPFYHPISVNEAELLVTPETPLIFCLGRSKEISMIYGAVYPQGGWAVCVEDVKFEKKNVCNVFTIHCERVVTLSACIEVKKRNMNKWIPFNGKPVINLKSIISVEEAVEDDAKGDLEYSKFVNQYKYIHSKLFQLIESHNGLSGIKSYTDGIITVSSLTYFRINDLICNVSIGERWFYIYVKNDDVRTATYAGPSAHMEDQVDLDDLRLIHNLCSTL